MEAKCYVGEIDFIHVELMHTFESSKFKAPFSVLRTNIKCNIGIYILIIFYYTNKN